MTLQDLARTLGGTFTGDPQTEIRGIAPIDRAAPGDVTFLANPKYREPSVATIWRGDHYILVRGVRATADPYRDPQAKILGVYVMDPNKGRPSWLGEDRYIPLADWLSRHFTPVTYLTPGSGVPVPGAIPGSTTSMSTDR